MPAVPDSLPRGVSATALRTATAARHRKVEQRIDVRRAFASPAAYRELLERLLGFHAPLEARLTGDGDLIPEGLRPLPPRSARLAADIAALGGEPRAIVRTAALPALSGGRVLGVLYVVEGSALGGAVLARLAQRRLGFDANSGASFFIGDAGAGMQTRWSTLLELVEEAGARHALDPVIEGACDTFDLLDAWLAGGYLGGSVSA